MRGSTFFPFESNGQTSWIRKIYKDATPEQQILTLLAEHSMEGANIVEMDRQLGVDMPTLWPILVKLDWEGTIVALTTHDQEEGGNHYINPLKTRYYHFSVGDRIFPPRNFHREYDMQKLNRRFFEILWKSSQQWMTGADIIKKLQLWKRTDEYKEKLLLGEYKRSVLSRFSKRLLNIFAQPSLHSFLREKYPHAARDGGNVVQYAVRDNETGRGKYFHKMTVSEQLDAQQKEECQYLLKWVMHAAPQHRSLYAEVYFNSMNVDRNIHTNELSIYGFDHIHLPGALQSLSTKAPIIGSSKRKRVSKEDKHVIESFPVGHVHSRDCLTVFKEQRTAEESTEESTAEPSEAAEAFVRQCFV
ncbi:MAG: hypothetical protein A3F41_05465 [Coxiella sp. RIFCSPHIGHO2_12_FULL_44_14]|nr:MAG: hypothetical protein A3F41_05465 [Coxiella sp. RIFCSPHIGHO2_12_FULL_44_14]